MERRGGSHPCSVCGTSLVGWVTPARGTSLRVVPVRPHVLSPWLRPDRSSPSLDEIDPQRWGGRTALRQLTVDVVVAWLVSMANWTAGIRR